MLRMYIYIIINRYIRNRCRKFDSFRAYYINIHEENVINSVNIQTRINQLVRRMEACERYISYRVCVGHIGCTHLKNGRMDNRRI